MVHVEYVVWDELMLTVDSSQRAQVLYYMCVYMHTDTDRQIDRQGKREREREIICGPGFVLNVRVCGEKEREIEIRDRNKRAEEREKRERKGRESRSWLVRTRARIAMWL